MRLPSIELAPEIVLLDIGMPDLNGYAVASALRSEPWARDIKLIALTVVLIVSKWLGRRPHWLPDNMRDH